MVPDAGAEALPDAAALLRALEPRHAPPLVPGLDDEVRRRVGKRDRDELGDVAAEDVRRAGAALAAEDPDLALLVGELLDAAGELRVAAPAGVGIGRAAVQCEARVAQEIQRLARAPHAAQPQLALGEDHLAAADPRRSVAA